MQNIISLFALLACFHAYTYAKWLRRNGNTLGAVGVILLIMGVVSLRLYWILMRKL